MKKCKFCAEEIQDEAIKCKYCGSNVEGSLPIKNVNETTHKKKLLDKKWNVPPMVLAWILGVVILLAVFGFWVTVGIALVGGLIWWLWKKSKLEKKKKIIFTSAIVGIFLLVFVSNAYANRAPSIKIFSPESNISVQAGSIQIQGKISPTDSVLTINGKNVETQSGSFTYEFALSNKVEKNDITLKAKANSKESEKTISVTRIFTEEEKLAMEKAKKDAELKAQQEKEARIAKEKAELEAYYRTPAGKICKAHPTWSKSDCELLADNRIWIGMEYDMVKYLRGLPRTVNTSNYGRGNQYQACWDYDYNPYCFYFGEDGIITSYN